jgi:hypothetical protein
MAGEASERCVRTPRLVRHTNVEGLLMRERAMRYCLIGVIFALAGMYYIVLGGRGFIKKGAERAGG